MTNKKVKTCKKCGKTYTGRYCKNRSCVNYHTGKAKARASASRRKVSRMHFGQLSAPIAPASSPVAGQGGSRISVNPSAVPVPIETPHEAMIRRANDDVEFFRWLCVEDSAGMASAEDEAHLSRYGW
jgi:hypothetical protein